MSALAGLRVAYLAFEPFPSPKGSGTRIGAMITGLLRAGAEVELVTLAGRSPAAAPVHPRLRLRPLLIERSNYLERALCFRREVARALTGIRPDLVHFRGVFEGEAALAYARRRSIPAVFEVNGLPSVELRYHYREVAHDLDFEARLRGVEQDCIARADLVLTQSRTTASFLRSRVADVEPVVIHNGVDPERFAAITPRPTAARGPARVLYVGTLAPWQGVLELLMATRRAVREQALTLRLVGPARRSWRQQIDRAIRRLRLREHAVRVDACSRTALADELDAADICVAPLRADLRNTAQGCNPIKLYEYMAAGRAVVATDLPCVREIVEPGVSGELIPAPKPKLLAAKLVELAAPESAERRAALGRAARDRVLTRETWNLRQQQLVRAYGELLARARA